MPTKKMYLTKEEARELGLPSSDEQIAKWNASLLDAFLLNKIRRAKHIDPVMFEGVRDAMDHAS